jgi:parvulin-like peptidyl-prolyl isomerase
VPTATPDTPETFQENYELFVENALKPARLDESYVRRMAEANVLRRKLQDAIVAEVPAEEEQVWFRYSGAQDGEAAIAKIAELQAGVREEAHARHILVETEEEAEVVLQRLADGEDFAALAAELSTDPSNKDEGGDLGWFGRGTMVPEFEQAVFEGEIGLYPEPVKTDFGYHIIEVLAREDRPVDLETELFDVGWYGKAALTEQFGALFAEMVFSADLGLLPDPVPTNFGVAIIEKLGQEVRTLDETEKLSRRDSLFEEWLSQVHEEGDIQNLWEPSMIPRTM